MELSQQTEIVKNKESQLELLKNKNLKLMKKLEE